jgi:hypothetical protein
MVSKQILYRQKSAERLDSLLVQHSASVDDGIRELVASELGEAAEAPDVRSLLATARQVLRRRREELWSASHALENQRAAEQARRHDVDEAAAALYEKVSTLRTHLRGGFGFLRGTALAGLKGDTPREPMKLLHEAERMVKSFTRGNLELPPEKVRVSGPEDWARMIAPAKQVLRDAYLAYLRAKQETVAAQIVKDEAMAAFDDALYGIAGLTEFLGHLAGQQALTKWARPSRRSRGLLHEAARRRRRKRRRSGASAP